MDAQICTGQHLNGSIATSSGQEIEVLGFLVWWNLREVDTTRDFFKERLDVQGLDGERYAREHNYRSTFIRALKALEAQRLIRKVTEDGFRLVYQFTNEVLVDEDENPRLEYTPEMTIEIDKDAYFTLGDISDSIVKCDEALKPVLVELFNKEKVRYTSSDVTRYVQKIFRDQSDIVSLRQQGSVYFVPASGSDLVQKVANILNDITAHGHGHASLEFFPVPDAESARNMVGNGVEAEIVECFSKMDDEIKKLMSGDGITDTWVNTRLDRVNKIKGRLGVYADVLGSKADALRGQFDAMAITLKKRKIEL